MTFINLLAASSQYSFPNEVEPQWGMLIVLYPFLTGIVAGAFILASLARVFNIASVKKVYRLSLLTTMAFMICAPLPLVTHLGHPENAWRIMLTPHLSSAMAIFGFVYLWYLVAVLGLQIWFEFRLDIIEKFNTSKGFMKFVYNCLTLGVKDTSEKAIKFDDKAGHFVAIIGIPSAIMLSGYVGFIFGSFKSNPWWSSVLMPVIILLSGLVSGIAVVMLVYIVTTKMRKQLQDILCLDAIGKYLMITLIFSLTIEVLDIVHHLYEGAEWVEMFKLLSSGHIFWTMLLVQFSLGGIVPLVLLAYAQASKPHPSVRGAIYTASAALILLGVLAMKWNVVIGGQLFSKSMRGLTTFHLELLGQEGLLVALFLMILPIFVLWAILKILPPWSAQIGARAMEQDTVNGQVRTQDEVLVEIGESK